MEKKLNTFQILIQIKKIIYKNLCQILISFDHIPILKIVADYPNNRTNPTTNAATEIPIET